MMKFLIPHDSRTESPLKKASHASELEELQKLEVILQALESQVAQKLKGKARQGLGIVQNLIASKSGGESSGAALDKENLHPNKKNVGTRVSGKGLGGSVTKSSPATVKSTSSTASRASKQKKGDVHIFVDATSKTESVSATKKSGVADGRSTRSSRKKSQDSEEIGTPSLLSSSDASPSVEEVREKVYSNTRSPSLSQLSVNTSESGAETESVDGENSSTAKSLSSLSDGTTYIDSEWEASSSARSSGSGSGSGTPLSSLRWGTPSRSSTDVAEVQIEEEAEVVEVDAGGEKKGRKKKAALLVRVAPSSGRESTGSNCSESSLASDADTEVLRPSDASDLSEMSPASLALPAPGTPGAKLLARSTTTPLSSKKTVGGSTSKSGSKPRLMCTPKSVKKMPPLPPSPSPSPGKASPLLVKSSRKRSPVSAKESPRNVSSSPAAASPASGNKRKKAREGSFEPKPVPVPVETAAAVAKEVDIDALSASAAPLLPQALALYKGMEGDSSRGSIKAGLLTYGPGDFVVVVALSFLLALRGEGEVVNDEANKLAALAPYLHYASMPTSLIQSQTCAEGTPPAAGGRSSLRQRAASAQPPAKKSVSFCQTDGSAVSPPNDRRPASWVNSYSISQRFHALVKAMDSIGAPSSAPVGATAFAALHCACQRFRCANKDNKESIEEAKRRLQSFFGPFLESSHGEMVESISLPRPFEAVRIFDLLLEDLTLTCTHEQEQQQQQQQRLSELRHRCSWMASSVIRYVVRWIYDEVPFNISTPSAAGPPVIPYCRSTLHDSMKLFSRADERLIQLCYSEEARSASEAAAEGEVGVSLALPCTTEVDPADMAVSALVSSALRQMDKVRELLLTRYPDLAVLISTSDSTAELAEAVERLVADSTAESDYCSTSAVQVILAAEYARGFLLELAEASEALSEVSFSLPYSDATLGSADAWTVISTCATMLRATGATDDRYLSLFAGGLPAFKSKLREPLLQQTTIQACQSHFRGVLQEQHEAKRVRVAARQAEREERRASSRTAKGTSSGNRKPVFCWDIVLNDIIFDFPTISIP